MTATREVTIWCDTAPAQPKMSCGMFVQSSGTATDLRGELRRSGWTHRAGRDYCRGCSDDLKAARSG